MSWFVYVLSSDRDGRRYIGCTQDLSKRLVRHQKGDVRTTKNRGPFSVILVEEFGNRSEAFAREKFLKSWAGRIELGKTLKKKQLHLPTRRTPTAQAN